MTARAEAVAARGERVLATAWKHFATRPYEGVLLREVAAEAEVTAQTLHARFGSKEDLFIAAYTWFGQQELAARPLVPAASVVEAVAGLFERYETHGQAVLRMLSQEERIPAVRRMTDAGRAYHREWVAATFAPLLRGVEGELRERRRIGIAVATDLLAWKLLRLDMGLDREPAEYVMGEMIEGLCGLSG